MKKKQNKSQLIRDLRAKDPNIGVTEIIAQLKKGGTPVSPPLVYQTLKRMDAPKGAPKKRGRKPKAETVKAASSNGSNGSINNELFSSMQNFVNQAGSLDKAIQILTVFKR